MAIEKENQEKSNSVLLRPVADLWILVVVGLPIGVLLPFAPFFSPPRNFNDAPPTYSQWLGVLFIFWLVAACFLLPSVWLLLFLSRAKVRADSSGLTWRILKDQRHVTWPEVLDFYDEPNRPTRGVIVTTRGKINLDKPHWNNLSELRDFVEEHAQNARTRKWQFLGARREDEWPRVFKYNPRQPLFAALGVAAVALFVTIVMLVGLINGWQVLRDIYSQVGLELSLVAVCGVLIVCSLYPLMAIAFLKTWRDTVRRKPESIEVSIEKIIFRNANTRIEAAWEEVLEVRPTRANSLHLASDHDRIVVTKHGAFEIGAIENSMELAAILRNFAPDAFVPKRPKTKTEGRRIFNCHTRASRIYFWGLLIFAVVCVLLARQMPHLGYEPGSSQDQGKVAWILAAAALVVYGFSWLLLRTHAIEFDDEMILQRTLFGTRQLRWTEIETLSLNWMELPQIKGGNQRLQFWPGINNVRELQMEIEARASQAHIEKSWREFFEKYRAV